MRVEHRLDVERLVVLEETGPEERNQPTVQR